MSAYDNESPPPLPGDTGDQENWDNESVLSDLDEETYINYNEHSTEIGVGGNEVIPIDEDTVNAIGKYKKKGSSTAKAPDVVESASEKRKRLGLSRDDDRDDVDKHHVEIELTEEESMFFLSWIVSFLGGEVKAWG
jgi:hypothetical protein